MTDIPNISGNSTFCFLASPAKEAQDAREQLIGYYGDSTFSDADIIIALGGDGMMLRALHKTLDDAKPIFGMNLGSVGFLMNDYCIEGLQERILAAEKTVIHPLMMKAQDINGKSHLAYAINEVSLLRRTHHTANLQLIIDGQIRITELISDGVLVSTEAGSTAYNLSAHGPILPLGSSLLALTPISPFRPRRWKGAIIPSSSKITIKVNNPHERPVNASADFFEIRNALEIKINQDRNKDLFMLFDPNRTLAEKVLHEQFLY